MLEGINNNNYIKLLIIRILLLLWYSFDIVLSVHCMTIVARSYRSISPCLVQFHSEFARSLLPLVALIDPNHNIVDKYQRI